VKRDWIFAVAALGALMVSAPAAADPLPPARTGPLLPAYEIRTAIRALGLEPVGPARLRGRNYVMLALDDDGREMRVVIDGRSGELVAAVPVRPLRRFAPGRRVATMPPPDVPYDLGPGYDGPDYDGPRVYRSVPDIYEEEPPPARPPAVIHRLPSATITRPHRTPLPRPRPASLASTGSIAAPATAKANPPAPKAKPATAATKAAAVEPRKPVAEPQKKDVSKETAQKKDAKVPAVAPLDPGAHAPAPLAN
jgi:hypothetical protein